MKFIRSPHLANNIVVIDGMSRSGKSLVTPLLSTFKRSELWLINYIYEELCSIDHRKQITPDAAETMIRLYADLDLYNLMIARGCNFRRTDVSGAFVNLLEKKYKERLRLPDGDVALNRIKKEKPILYLMVHYIFNEADLLFRALEDRLKLYI